VAVKTKFKKQTKQKMLVIKVVITNKMKEETSCSSSERTLSGGA